MNGLLWFVLGAISGGGLAALVCDLRGYRRGYRDAVDAAMRDAMSAMARNRIETNEGGNHAGKSRRTDGEQSA